MKIGHRNSQLYVAGQLQSKCCVELHYILTTLVVGLHAYWYSQRLCSPQFDVSLYCYITIGLLLILHPAADLFLSDVQRKQLGYVLLQFQYRIPTFIKPTVSFLALFHYGQRALRSIANLQQEHDTTVSDAFMSLCLQIRGTWLDSVSVLFQEQLERELSRPIDQEIRRPDWATAHSR